MAIVFDAPEQAELSQDRLSGALRTNVIDRWIYVFTAASLIAVVFAIFMWIALRARTRDAGLHKRMMFLAITAAMGAAIVRIRWLPTTFPNSTLTLDVFSLLPLAPMLVWDLVRNRDLHRAYLIWAAF